MVVRRWVQNKNGKPQRVRIKKLKEWKTTHTKIGKYKGRDLWIDNKLKQEPVKFVLEPRLFHHFCKLNKYEDKPSDFIKIEISYFASIPDLKTFEDKVKDFLRENFNNSIANDAEYVFGDIDETDKVGDFQFLLRNRDVSNSDFVKPLKNKLEKVMM